MHLTASLGPLYQVVTSAAESLTESDTVGRFLNGDHPFLPPVAAGDGGPVGWRDRLTLMSRAVSEMEMFAGGVRADGLTKVVLCGSGTGAVFPTVLAETFPVQDGLPLSVLDASDPAAVDRILADREITETLFIGSSLSGTTSGTTSLVGTFWSRLQRGPQFTVITGANSPLVALADRQGFRRVFVDDGVGHDPSVISYAGFLPGALVGAPIARILSSAAAMIPLLEERSPTNPAIVLGATIAAAAEAGRDKCTILLDDRIAPLGAWLEHVLAGSNSGGGRGVVPVVGEPPSAAAYGADRLFILVGTPDGADQVPHDAPQIHVSLDESTDLGAQLILWDIASRVSALLLKLDPTERSNTAATDEMAAAILQSGTPVVPLVGMSEMLASLSAGDYLHLGAYVDPGSSTPGRLDRKLRELGRRHGVATTFGIGPRALHSTAGLHEDGPNSIVVLQIVAEDRTDVAILDQPFTFSQLKTAQAAAEYAILKNAGRRVGRVALTEFLDA